jgi:hypothetical protein
MFMFGMRCVRCDHEIIAPRDTELLDDRVIRHVWHCPSCKARFESFPRFPKGAKQHCPCNTKESDDVGVEDRFRSRPGLSS